MINSLEKKKESSDLDISDIIWYRGVQGSSPGGKGIGITHAPCQSPSESHSVTAVVSPVSSQQGSKFFEGRNSGACGLFFPHLCNLSTWPSSGYKLGFQVNARIND